jgi:DNA-binding CsgD family transcriptional regulator
MHGIREAHPTPEQRELEILVLLSYGEKYEDLAFKYDTTKHSICTKVYRMRTIFGVDTNAEMVALALRSHWIQ